MPVIPDRCERSAVYVQRADHRNARQGRQQDYEADILLCQGNPRAGLRSGRYNGSGGSVPSAAAAFFRIIGNFGALTSIV